MNYIYDVLSNFQFSYYDFFEWNKDDEVIRIRKIPIIKVDNKLYYDLKYSKVKVERDFLNKIEDKTEVFKNRGIDTISYSCIFTNGKEGIIVKFDNKGYNMYKSAMMMDEEREVIEDTDSDKIINIEYDLISENVTNFNTRKENKLICKLRNDINKLYENEEYSKLSYLYFECFNIKDTNYTKIKDELLNGLSNSKILEKIGNFIKLISNV